MKNKILKLGATALFGATLVSCGGSDGGTVLTDETGVFLDSAVAGLYYTSAPSGKSGRTDDFGQFSYTTGDTVEFKVGGTQTGAVLGSITGQSVVMPEDIADGATGTKSAKIAILLQSMDADGDATNGIDLGNNIINSTMAATIKAILLSSLETGTHTFSANNIASFTAKTVASATAHMTTKASATAHIDTTKKTKDSSKISGGKLKLTTVALTGENGSSFNKYTRISAKSSLFSTATTKVSVDMSLDSYGKITGGTNTGVTWVETVAAAIFVNRANASDTFKVILKVYEDTGSSRGKLYVKCSLSSVCESGSTNATAVAYINSSNAALIDTTASKTETDKANYTRGTMKTMSIEHFGNDGTTHTFTINGVKYDGTGNFVSLDKNANYDFQGFDMQNAIHATDDKVSSSSSFDNFKVNGILKDDFNDGLDKDVWTLPTTATY